MDERSTVLGIDNIPLELPVAGVGSRVLAAVVDYLAVGLLTALLGLVAIGVGSASGRAGLFWLVFAAGSFLLQWGYFAAFEIALGGRTPGKALVGLRTVQRTGGAAGAGALVVRNLMRAIDLFAAVPMIAFDPLARRLGDHLAGTLVIHARRPARPVLGRVPPRWGAREVALAESLLARAGELEGERAERLAHQLLAWIERDAPEMLADSGDPAARRAAPVEALRRALAAERG